MPSVWERRWKSWRPQGSVCFSVSEQCVGQGEEKEETDEVGVVGVCAEGEGGVGCVAFGEVRSEVPELAI